MKTKKAGKCSPLFLLKRVISPYNAGDELLGVFRTRVEARKARRAYIDEIQSGKRRDPWKEQAFRRVNLNGDVRIVGNLPTSFITDQTKLVYVVTRTEEGFGQIDREYIRISGRAVGEEIELGHLYT